jgi:hypothetical protein
MSNSSSKRQCKIKRQVRQRKIDIESETNIAMGVSSTDMQDTLLMELFVKFGKGPMRHGCNRKYYAKRKVDERKSQRMKQREADRDEVTDTTNLETKITP